MRLKNMVYLGVFVAFIGIKFAGYMVNATGQGGQGKSASPAVFSSQPSSILASYGSWSATKIGSQFIEISTSAGPKFAFYLPDDTQHFVIALSNSDKNMPSGSSVPIKLLFNDGYVIPLVGTGSQSELDADLPDEMVAEWTHHFTADSEMTVIFPNSLEANWKFSLSGTTQTISAMAKGIEAAGITALPAPWYAAPNPVSQNATEQVSQNTVQQNAAEPVSQNAVQQEHFGGVPIPASQEAIISLISQYMASLSSAPNPVKAGDIEQEFLQAFCAAIQNVDVTDWVGVLDSVQNVNDANGTTVGISLRISFPTDAINYGGIDGDFTLENDNSDTISDPADPFVSRQTTMIPVGTPLYDTVTNLRIGDTIVFSGDLIPYSSEQRCENSASDLFAGNVTAHILENVIQFHDIEDTGH